MYLADTRVTQQNGPSALASLLAKPGARSTSYLVSPVPFNPSLACPRSPFLTIPIPEYPLY